VSHSDSSLFSRLLRAYANLIVGRPALVLIALFALGGVATWGATKLTINSNQLDLISQDLQEVKDVKRLIGMIGGTGHLIIALRADDAELLKKVSDDVAARLRADTENFRHVTYKVPVEFIQENMVLFVQNEDLLEGKKRIMRYLRDQVRRASPFFFELTKTDPVKLDLSDLVEKYSSVGKKSIRDDYYISPDRKMLLLVTKPMWDSNVLEKTRQLVEKVQADFADYSRNNAHGVKLVEDYELVGTGGTVAYGFTGSYKTNVDDSYAIANSLHPITVLAFLGILVITLIFFRRVWPSLIVITGTVLGTVLAMGFTYATVGQLNMITSILAGLLLGFGVDYGIHLTYRTRIELGEGKPYDVAIRDALVQAGRPATVAAIVTGGSFFVLMVCDFRGFSQFGFLAGAGTMIIGLTLFSFCGALLALLGRRWPSLPEKIVGKMDPYKRAAGGDQARVPAPKRLLTVSTAVVALLCLLAIPWRTPSADPSWFERLTQGVRFNYNSRALMPEDQHSVILQDEIARRFQISADPTAIFTKTLEEAKELYDSMHVPGKYAQVDKEKYPTVDQVVSIFSFVPPPENAAKNAAVLAQWKEELADFDLGLLPEELQSKRPFFEKIMNAQPFDVSQVPEIYAKQFRTVSKDDPENTGYMTFLYPNVDLWDGVKLMEFADQTGTIETPSGHEYRSAGLAVIFAKLARIVLRDGIIAVFLAALWILVMHYLDFRSVPLAAASVIPLGVGLVVMLGIMSLVNHRLNFMNIIILPILLGFGVSHGLYLLHRFLEGTSPIVALRSVGAAVASSTLTAIAGFGALFVASHNGLKSMGFVACLGLTTTLVVSFTVLAAVLQMIHDRRAKASAAAPTSGSSEEKRAANG
jgi:uncharacterized protein